MHTGSRSESFWSCRTSWMTWRSAASRPVLRVRQRVWRMYSTDSFEFDLTSSGKWSHSVCSISTHLRVSVKLLGFARAIHMRRWGNTNNIPENFFKNSFKNSLGKKKYFYLKHHIKNNFSLILIVFLNPPINEFSKKNDIRMKNVFLLLTSNIEECNWQ